MIRVIDRIDRGVAPGCKSHISLRTRQKEISTLITATGFSRVI